MRGLVRLLPAVLGACLLLGTCLRGPQADDPGARSAERDVFVPAQRDVFVSAERDVFVPAERDVFVPAERDVFVSAERDVIVSIPPQRYFVQAIAGERVRVEVLVQPGQDPHSYEPSPKQMARLAQAGLYFRIGVAFEEPLIPRIMSNNPGLTIVDTRQGITLRQMEQAADEEGQEEHGDGEALHGPDPHTWMSPRLARLQARTIRDALIALDPAGRQVYESGYRDLAAELDRLHADLAAALAAYRGREILVYHPAYGYFADEYGLHQVAVESGGSEPSARQLARLIDQARRRQVKIVFVQPQFSQTGARAVAEAIGGAVVALDPLAENYLANLREMALRVAEALR